MFWIAQGWGKQLRPPDELKKAVINLVKLSPFLDVQINDHLYLDESELFEIPFIYITSDKPFNLTKAEAENFGKYLHKGGFAFIDNGAPDQNGDEVALSLKKMFSDALGKDVVFRPISNDHILYYCFNKFMDGPPTGKRGEISDKRYIAKRYLEGIWIGERLAAVYCDFGYGYRWIESENKSQKALGVNLVVFALLQENGIMTGHTEKSSPSDTISFQPSIEKETKQPQPSKYSLTNITLLENGEYDIDGTHATSETIEQVLKPIMDKYPEKYRSVLISGTPKDKIQLKRAWEIGIKFRASTGVDPNVIKALGKNIYLNNVTNTNYIIINIIKMGEYEIDGIKATDEDFIKVLKAELAKTPKKSIRISSNSGATVFDAFALKDLAKKAGIKEKIGMNFSLLGSSD